MEWILEDAIFERICNINNITYEIIDEFIQSYISKHPNNNLLLKNLSNLYVLYGMLNSDNCVKLNEKKWKDILNDEQYKIIEKNNYYILGFIWIDEKKSKNNKVHYIEFIDTRVKGYNLAKLMIDKYEKNYKYINEDISCLPYEIIESSAKYWKEYFDYIINSKEDYEKFIIDMKIDEDEIKWEYLTELLE
jgi:hypothetical protein